MQLSIVIPAYNEEARIGLTLERTIAFLNGRPWSCEVLVVDDGSLDRTAAVVEEYAARHSAVRCLRNSPNRGKGYSIRQGVSQAVGEYIGFMDADYKTDIAGLDSVMLRLQEGWDGVIGDRTLGESCIGRPRRHYREWGSRLFRRLLQGLGGLGDFGDTQCGFKFFRAPAMRELFGRQQADGYMFDVEVLLLAVRLGYRLCPIPVDWQDDPDSRFRPFSGSLRNLGELLRIRWRLRGQPRRTCAGQLAGRE